MKVRIIYSNSKNNHDNLYKIFCDVIKKDIEKKQEDENNDEGEGEGDEDEKDISVA